MTHRLGPEQVLFTSIIMFLSPLRSSSFPLGNVTSLNRRSFPLTSTKLLNAAVRMNNFLSFRPSDFAPTLADSSGGRGRRQARLTSPEKWEIKQMISAGVLDKKDYPDFNEETGILKEEDEDAGSDEDVEIDMVEDEPPFLRGQTKQSLQMSPVKIVKVRLAAARARGWRGGEGVVMAEEPPFLRGQTKKPKMNNDVHVCTCSSSRIA